MPIAVWNDRFATGIDTIDRQHQQLFTAVNQLHEAYSQGKAHEQVAKSVEFLLRYTEDHFRAEEDHMQRIAYPGLAVHLEAHARLLERVAALKTDHDTGLPVAGDLAALLADWLKQHICEVDLPYVDFVKGAAS
jgi:hemerythrin-like metal-binding protein